MVAQLRKKLSDTEVAELRAALRHSFDISDMTTRNEGGRMVNMAALALSCLAEFCPAQEVLELVFSRFPSATRQGLKSGSEKYSPNSNGI